MKTCKNKEFVLVGNEIKEGIYPAIKISESEVEFAIIKPMVEGKPIDPTADLIKLTKNQDGPGYEMEYIYKRSGPTKVNSKAYRDNYDRIFGAKDSKDVN
jgi:hypothetical protein